MSVFIDSKRPGVTHNVKDLRKAAEWYRDILGFEIGPHDYVSFVELCMQGQYMFHLTPACEGTVPHPEPVFWLTSTDLEKTHSVLMAKGVKAGDMSWYPDYSSFTFRDLDGNAIGVSQSFEMRIRELDELKLIGIRVVCADGDQYLTAIPQAAKQLRQRIDEIAHVIDPHRMVGAYKPGDTLRDEDGYWVSVRVERFGTLPDGMVQLTIPPGRYAVKWHYGPRSTVADTYRKLHRLADESVLQLNTQAWHVEMQRHWGAAEETDIEMDLYCAIE